jgi:hypothetical protein
MLRSSAPDPSHDCRLQQLLAMVSDEFVGLEQDVRKRLAKCMSLKSLDRHEACVARTRVSSGQAVSHYRRAS